MTVGKQHEKEVEHGFFDERFVQRAEESKKVSIRKEKYQKKDRYDLELGCKILFIHISIIFGPKFTVD